MNIEASMSNNSSECVEIITLRIIKESATDVT